MKAKPLLTAIVLSIVLAACVLLSTPAGTTLEPTATTTPSLEPAIDFEKGISNIPEGYYIFLEFFGRSKCSDECNCAPEARAPLYEITPAGELWIISSLIGVTSTGASWIGNDLEDRSTLSSPIAGFFVYDDDSSMGQVQVVAPLPFTVTPFTFTRDAPAIATIYSIEADGTAVVEVYGKTYFIKPGQSWTESGDWSREPPSGCRMSYSDRLTNLGLFAKTQVRFGYPDQHP
jgi:hypothetical protein